MRRYYTRVCNFYYGKESRLLVNTNKSIPLNGNINISFDHIEIISRTSKKKISIKKINSLTKSLKEHIKKDLILNYLDITAQQKYSRHPKGRFTEASLIKRMDDLGIGRPSTYATMISNVQDREYTIKKTVEGEEKESLKLYLQNGNEVKETKTMVKVGGEKNKLFPTDMGNIVNRCEGKGT